MLLLIQKLRFFLRILISIIVLFLGTSCSEKPHNNQKEILRLNFAFSPQNKDPRKFSDPISLFTSRLIFDGLMQLAPDGSVENNIANTVSVDNQFLRYVITLKKTTWSNGTPLLAHDFERSWKEVLSPGFNSTSTSLLYIIKNGEKAKKGTCSTDLIGVKAINDYLLEVMLEKPSPHFTKMLTHPVFFPTNVKNGDYQAIDPEKMITNGPYVIKIWANDNEIYFERNQCYWNREQLKLRGIHASIIADESTALKLFEQGQMDFLGGLLSPLPVDSINNLKKKKLINHKPVLGTTFITFNTQKPPFDNVNIRKAFSLAVDKEELTEHVTQKYDYVAHGLTPFFKDKNFTTGKKKDILSQSVALFEKGLSETGFSRENLPPITLRFFKSDIQNRLAQAIQHHLKSTLGISIEIICEEYKSHLIKLRSGEFNLALMSWIGQYSDPLSFLERAYDAKNPYNYANWESDEYKRYIDASFCSSDLYRNECLEKAEKVLSLAVPFIPICHFESTYIISPSLKELAILPTGDLYILNSYFQNKKR